jgi:plasmid stability protein
MATVTIRQVPPRVVRALKALASQHARSMEQEVRVLLAEYVGERHQVLADIEAAWERQRRRPSGREIASWIERGRR